MRILLFLLTNLAVVIVVGTVWRLLGFDSFLAANGGARLQFAPRILCPVWYGRFFAVALHLKVDGKAKHRHAHY